MCETLPTYSIQSTGFQNGVPEPAASPGNLLHMQILGPCLDPLRPSPGVGPINLCFVLSKMEW